MVTGKQGKEPTFSLDKGILYKDLTVLSLFSKGLSSTPSGSFSPLGGNPCLFFLELRHVTTLRVRECLVRPSQV